RHRRGGGVQRLLRRQEPARAHGIGPPRARPARARPGRGAVPEGRGFAPRAARCPAHVHCHQHRLSTRPERLLGRRVPFGAGGRNGSTMNRRTTRFPWRVLLGAVLVSAVLPACKKTQAAASVPPPPPGEAWLTSKQVADAKIAVSPLTEHEVDNA